MARQIKSFINDAAIQAAIDDKSLDKPYVALDEETGKIDWNSKFIDYAGMYLTIEALEDGDLSIALTNIYPTRPGLSYSINGGEWQTTTTGITIPLATNDKVRFKGTFKSTRNIFQNNTIAYNAYGNIESLHHGDDFSNVTQAGTYGGLFKGSNIVSAENLILPATTLALSCYENMFQGCTGLTAAPALPATNLAGQDYSGMFQGCTSLTKAPSLPAATLAASCYRYMFDGCSNLTVAPELPATAVIGYAYQSMFKSCTNLNYIKCLATSWDNPSNFADWVYGVASTGTFVKAAGVEWPTGRSGIPSNWTVVEE